MTFLSSYRHGFARVAACTVPVHVADPEANAVAVLDAVHASHREGVAVVVLPEMCLTGYAIDDLVLQDALLDAADAAVARVVEGTRGLLPIVFVGAPVRRGHRVYNCAVAVHDGRVLGVAPKSYLPTYREFYDARYFASGVGEAGEVVVAGQVAPFGADLLFAADDVPGLVVHAEVCEDMWVPVPPSAQAALAGATVLVNLSGSPITVSRAEDRRLLARSASARCIAAHVYAAAGEGESTTDLSWDGQTLVHEAGRLLAEGERFSSRPQRVVADVDLDLLRQERSRVGTFDDNARALSGPASPAVAWQAARAGATPPSGFRTVPFSVRPPTGDIGLRRDVARFPFVPHDPDRLAQDCYEAYSIQVAGLRQRLAAIGGAKVVIGVSGGLDSTHALLVAAQAMDLAGRPRTDIVAYTMPGFATGTHTRTNAHRLMDALGVEAHELDIRPAARQMLADLDHPFAAGEPVHDVTFENVQAGLRTDYLFRLANHRGGIVLGTGDLSELALGWCTYGVGDQMSHYNVNAGVPKTLMQHLIRWVVASGRFSPETGEVLRSILDTEISPELVPPGADGTVQSTEATIGPYALHDFTLFHVLRYGMRPSKIAFLAQHAWRDVEAGGWPAGFPEADRVAYDLDEIQAWLRVFLRRFFQFSQFKRSAMPNGPKVSAGGSLSPRGDWRQPSDASAAAWLRELDDALGDKP